METSSCPGWWVLHGVVTSLSQVEHATKLSKGLKALGRLEQALALGLVRRTRTPEILAYCSQAPTSHREWGASLGADHVPSPFLTLFPGWAQRNQDPAAAIDKEKPQLLQRSWHGNTSSSSQQSRAAGDAQNHGWERRWEEEEERRRILV